MHLHKVLADHGQEVRLYCFSEACAAKERGIVERFAQRFETALTELSEGLSKPRTHKRVDKVWQRIGRLKEKSRGIAQHYDIELDTDKSGKRATAVRFTRQALPGSMMTHPGVYCLRSNETDWDEAILWRTYFMLTDLEAVFRHAEIRTRATPHLSPQAHSCRRASVHHRARVSACTGHPHPAAGGGGRERELDYVAAHRGRSAAHHRHLHPRRRAHRTRAKGYPCRAASAGNLRRVGHQRRPWRNPQNYRVEHLPVPTCSATCPSRSS